MQVRQFQRDPAEQKLMDEKAKRAQANLGHQNVRVKLQAALLDRAESSAELVVQGIEWARSDDAQYGGSFQDRLIHIQIPE